MAATPQKTYSRRSVLASLPVAGVAAAMPMAAIADHEPLLDLINRHKTAAAALDRTCLRLAEAEQAIRRKYPAEVCLTWIQDNAAARGQWLKIRKAHGIAKLEQDRQRLDEAEKDLALELIASPCRTIEEARLKALYIKGADIILKRLSGDESCVSTLLSSLG